MDRRSFLTGAASLATLAGVRNADALTQAEKELLLGGVSVPYPAPPGFHWAFVIDDLTGQQITDDVTGQIIMDLVGN